MELRLSPSTGILHLTRYESIDIIGSDPLKKGARTRSFDDEFAHVGNVKDPGLFTNSEMLGLEPFILNGHIVSCKRNHLGPFGQVLCVQSCFLQALFIHGCVLEFQIL